MKEQEYDFFDDFIRKKLGNIHPKFEETAWEAMQAKLNALQPSLKPKISPHILRMRWLSASIAAIFLGASFWFLLTTTDTLKPKITHQTNKERKIHLPHKIVEKPLTHTQKNSFQKNKNTVIPNITNTLEYDINFTNRNNRLLAKAQFIPLQWERVGVRFLKKYFRKKSNTFQNESDSFYVEKQPSWMAENKIIQTQDKQIGTKNDPENNTQKLVETQLITPITPFSFRKSAIDEIGLLVARPSLHDVVAVQPTKFSKRTYLGLIVSPEKTVLNNPLITQQKTNAKIGGYVEWQPYKVLGVGFGTTYSRKKYEINPHNFSNNYQKNGAVLISSTSPQPVQIIETSSYQTDVADFTADLKFYISLPRQWRMYLSSGVSSYYFMNQKLVHELTKTSFYNTTIQVAQKTETEIPKQAFYALGSIDFGLGIQKSMRQNMVLQMNPYYKFPLRKIGADNYLEVASLGLRMCLMYQVR
jgi:hypothetical protein